MLAVFEHFATKLGMPGHRVEAGGRSYGFRSYEAISAAVYHRLGKLPEPPLIHRFC